MDLYLRSSVNTIFRMFYKLIYFIPNVWMTTLFVLLIQFLLSLILISENSEGRFYQRKWLFCSVPVRRKRDRKFAYFCFLIFKNVLPLIENWHSFRYHKVESKPETIWFNMKLSTAHGDIFRILLKTSKMEHFTNLVNG